ncbi:MAG: hypothetical protein M3Z05_17890 [Gemmatimonadota bacterium]|nr:hypothetical protein [Gemmatimonadota bacterium]
MPPELTRDAFTRLLDEEASNLDARVWEIFDMYAIPSVRAVHRWEHDGRLVEAPVWLVAMSGTTVIGYDEVEAEYGVGRVHAIPTADGTVVEDWGTFGERLSLTLQRFSSILVSEPPLSD